MLPLIIIGGILVGGLLIAAVLAGPTKENETVSEIEARLKREEEIAAQKRKNMENAKRIREERKRYADEIAENQKRLEEILRRTTERDRQHEMRLREEARVFDERRNLNQRLERRNQQLVDRQRQVDEAATRRNLEDEKRKRKEEDIAARHRSEQAESEREKRELLKKMDSITARERILQEEIEKANRMVEQERAARLKIAKNGDQPLRWPTREEFQQALDTTQYSDTNFHFAIVGRAGSGKSSLINAFRNLGNKDPGAAKAGTKETTLVIGRYPDPSDQPPRLWTVWFDIPGAGTQRIPHYEYFNKQGLFIFDIIILAMGDRFEEIDVKILENCARFKIPAFIVRSKADMHILNSMQEYDEDYKSIEDNEECYLKCRDEFIKGTQQTVSEGLKMAGLPDQPVYIVSRSVLRRTYNSTLERSRLPMDMIHENYLVERLISAASQRRCNTEGSNSEQTPFDKVKAALSKDNVKAAISTFTERFKNQNHDEATEKSDLEGFFPIAKENQAVTNIGATTSKLPKGKNHKKQPNHQNTRWIKKVIYPRSTNTEELEDELARSNPELPNMLAVSPIMFKPTIALLNFYPLAPIPQEIYAFGKRLRLVEFKEKTNSGGTRKERASHSPGNISGTPNTHTRIPKTTSRGVQNNQRPTQKPATYTKGGKQGADEESS